MNPDQPLGNYVVIDHQNGEYSFLAHLKQGSVAVQVGVRVEPGDLLGLCGNSGNSSEPHLHYHLQNAPGFPGGQGLPAQFQSYTADGVMVERGEPVRGQVVAP
jgi:murein DD-endopeptidase MepM/ murein hydrolase activator NlpD